MSNSFLFVVHVNLCVLTPSPLLHTSQKYFKVLFLFQKPPVPPSPQQTQSLEQNIALLWRHCRRILSISTFCFNPGWKQVGNPWDFQLEGESLPAAPGRTEPCSACVQHLWQHGLQLRAHNGWHGLTYLYVQFPLVLFEHPGGIKSVLGLGRGSLRAILHQLNGDNFKDHQNTSISKKQKGRAIKTAYRGKRDEPFWAAELYELLMLPEVIANGRAGEAI